MRLGWNNAILIWDFYQAPKEYRRLSQCGGDEDYLAFVPTGVRPPHWVEDAGPLGACSVDRFEVDGGTVFIGCHS